MRDGRRGLIELAVVATVTLVVSLAFGQERGGRRTWGAAPDAPAASAPVAPPNAPSASASASTSATPPPPPPPTTLGEPVDGASPTRVPSPAPVDADAQGPIVRAPGRVGLRYTLEGIEVRGNSTTLARVVLRYVPFRAGDTLDVDDRELEYTRFRLLGTGFFRDVRLSLRKGSRRGYVVLLVQVVERNTMIVNDLWLGLAADAEPSGTARPLSAYGGVQISETNLAGTGVTLGGALALAENQLALRTHFVDPQFFRTSWAVEVALLYNNAKDFFGNRDVLVDYGTHQAAQDYAVLDYRRFGGTLGAGHDLGISTQLYLGYRLEKVDANVPLAASHHRGLDVEPIDFMILPGTSVLSTVRGTIVYDTRDTPVLPTRGEHVILSADASLTPLGSDYPYVKATGRVSHWLELPWEHVLRIEGFAGAVFGNAPLFERFYIGDFTDLLPDRVLDLNVDRRPAPNFFGTDIVEIRYGQYAAKVQAEYRIPIYRGHRSIYGIDFFTAAGLYAVANGVDLTDRPRGYTGFETIPIDLTFNLGLRVDTAAGGVMFGLSNFLGFLPFRGSDAGAAR
jgi:outer membrane protein assembly factor BamA